MHADALDGTFVSMDLVANILRPNERVVIHNVKAGETLYGLAKKHGVSQEEIKLWNALGGPKMRVGQDILIYKAR